MVRHEAELGPHPLRCPQLHARAVRLDERRLFEQAALDVLVVRDEEPPGRAVVALDLLALDELAHAPPVAQREPEHRRCLPLGPDSSPARPRRELRTLGDEPPVLADGVLGTSSKLPPFRPLASPAGSPVSTTATRSPRPARWYAADAPVEARPPITSTSTRPQLAPRAEARERLLAAQPVRRVVAAEGSRSLRGRAVHEERRELPDVLVGGPRPAEADERSDQRSSGVQSDRCDAIGPRYGFAAARISSCGNSSGQAHAAPRVREQPLHRREDRRRDLQRRRVLVRREPPRLVDVEQRAVPPRRQRMPISSTPSSSRPSTMSSFMIRCAGWSSSPRMCSSCRLAIAASAGQYA